MRYVQTSSRLVLAAALATLVLAGCGSASHTSAPSTVATTTVPPTAAITVTWESFFGPSGNAYEIQGMNAVLQPAYTKSRSGSLGKGSSATVSSVKMQTAASCASNQVPSPCAEVTYNILINGTVALPNATGYATEVGGKWLVAKATFCALESLEDGSPPAGCS